MSAILKFLGFNPGPIQTIENISLNLAWGWAGLVLTLLILLPVIYFLYRFEERKLNNKDRKIILALRFAFVILFALMLTGPVLSIAGLVPQKNRLAILIDSSKSMGIKSESLSRLDKIKTTFSQGRLIEKLEQKTGIKPEIFSFAANVSPLSQAEIKQFNLKANGNQTNISKAAADITGNLGEGSLLGLIMMTDGVHTVGENPAIALGNLRTPIYFVGPGGSDQSKDLAVNIPRPPATGYLNSSVRVSGQVSRFGVDKEQVEIQINKNEQPFKTIKVNFDKNKNKQNFSFTLPCDKEGLFKYEVKIPEIENEITNENNQADFLLKVVRERLNILSVSGKPSWDIKFIVNALSTDPNAGLVSWVRLKDDRWICNRDFKLQAAVRKPTLSKDLEDTDVVILRGVPYNFIKPLAQEISDRVESGNLGLLILPGTKGLRDLGYQNTVIENLLPVKPGNEKWRGTPGNILLSSQETPYNFLRLVDDPIENVEFFATLPKFDGLYEYGAIRPSAEVLLQTTVRSNADPLPFLIRNRIGQGNSVMITGAPIWPMGFRLISSDKGFSPYTAFLTNMLKWLANRREDAQVSLELASAKAYTGQPVSIKVWVSNARHQLQSGAQVSLTITDPKGETTPLSCMETSEKGCYEGTFVPAFRGLHKIEATARMAGRELGKTSIELLIDAPTDEFANPVIAVEQMKKMAEETGGIYCSSENTDLLVDSIKAIPGKKSETRLLDLRNSWALLILMLIFPLCEWYLRRIRGLS
ncbi:MAG: hypothetical protein ACQETH_10320 [Candidatus Rifleibacteriota bacterium]